MLRHVTPFIPLLLLLCALPVHSSTYDEYVTVTHESWFDRLYNSFMGVGFGFLFMIGSFVLLGYNEFRARKRYCSLKEGLHSVRSINSNNLDNKNNQCLVHLTGRAQPGEDCPALIDYDHGIDVEAIKLRRIVETYQWVENTSSSTNTKSLSGQSTTKTVYSYKKEWRSHLIRTSDFKQPLGHDNPQHVKYADSEQSASTVFVDEFQLCPELVSQINNWEDLPSVSSYYLRAEGKYYYNGTGTLMQPEVGDQRIYFQVCYPLVVSVVGSQDGNLIGHYNTKAGGSILLLEQGTKTAEQMFNAAQSSNVVLTWLLRIIGFAAMWIAIALLIEPIGVLSDIIPIIGGLVRLGTFFISLSVAGVLSLVTIALAWLSSRPGLTFVLLAGVVAIVWFTNNAANQFVN